MIYDVISVTNMRESDKATIENNTPSLELMRRAGLVCFKAIKWKGNIDILVGKGNNGGDGFALACLLAKEGYSPVVYKLSEEISDDSFYFEKEAKKLSVIINEYIPHISQLDDADIIVDCLLGTGFNGTVKGIYKDCIDEINSYKTKTIVSVDINSGVSGDKGKTRTYVKADITIVIQAIKYGLLSVLNETKNIYIGDIGIKLLNDENSLVTADEFSNYDLSKIFKEKDLSYVIDSEKKVYLLPEGVKVKKISYK